MGSCCRALEDQFGSKQAARDLKRFRRRGPARATRILVEALLREGVSDSSLLDIGGGVGAIEHALLPAGLRDATDVDASAAYLSAAREEARRRGTAERIRFLHGDFVELADQVDAADIVTLDRVICCYPDMEALVRASAERALRLYGLVYPRTELPFRLAAPLINLALRLRGTEFRVYLHDESAVDGLLRALGFEPRFLRTTPLWQVHLYQRADELSAPGSGRGFERP